MIINSAVLFVSALLGGLSIHVLSSDKINIKNLLIFAGAYLFSVTVIHILPELFHASNAGFSIGLAVLCGFFFQHVLEYFTSGVEHGHMHDHPAGHSHGSISAISLMLSLCLHAFLEGSLIAYPEVFGESHKVGSLLFGVVLHKVPAALALMTVLSCQFSSNRTTFILLLLFAISSPLGLLFGSYLEPLGLMNTNGVVLLFGFVAGNFLHISTTIFIESSPDHSFGWKRTLVSLLGAGVAIVAEWLM
ncbi:MAG: ZIP family metal transporter [Cytophagales bacterium]|nr:ZIP family metal transporter [Cytophagales bacterium]